MQIKTLVLGSYETNCYLLWQEGRDDCLVIDPGYEPERILQELRAQNKRLAAILLTHGHFDHVGAVRTLFAETDCDIYLCPDDCVMPENMTAGALCYTCAWQEGDKPELAGISLQVLHTPGHTPGSVCLLCGDVLFSGDTLFAGSCGRTDLPCGSWEQLRASLHRLRALPDGLKVYPGHGQATRMDTEKTYNPYLR